jgi:hypothetical protein
MNRTTQYRWQLRIALIFASVLLSLGIAELAIRLLGSRPQTALVMANPDFDSRLRSENNTALEADAAALPDRSLYVNTPTGKRMRANSIVTIRNHEVSGRDIELRTSSIGLRNPEIGDKADTRVLFLGDSITLADYVDESESFVRQIEIEAAEHGGTLETINAGIGGVGLETELAILVETGLDLDPDIVVLCFYLNDVESSPGVTVSAPPHMLRWSWIAWTLARNLTCLTSAPVRAAAADAKVLQWQKAFVDSHDIAAGDARIDEAAFNELIVRYFYDWGNAWTLGAWERMQPIFSRFSDLSQQHDFKLLLLVFPVRFQVESSFDNHWPQDRFRELAVDLNLPVLDLLPKLRSVHEVGSAPLFYDQCHYTEYGNAVVAEIITTFVLKHRQAE